MAKRKSNARIQNEELFLLLKELTDAYAALQSGLKQLREVGLIDRKRWRREVVAADLIFFQIVRKLWIQYEVENSSIEFSSEMIREEDLAKKWKVSRKTLYRRRKNRELPYIKDRHGDIWYPLSDVAQYLEKNKITPLTEKPRKI